MSAQTLPHRTSRHPLPPQPSHATLCSLRGGDSNRAHPLRQNPPSIAASFDDAFDDIPLAPPPSALTSRPTHYDHDQPSPLDIYPPIDRRHQRSLTDTFFDNCKPIVTRATTSFQQTSKPSLHSPTKSLASFIPSRATLESAGQAKPRVAKVFSDWFGGSSAPVALGVASRPEEPEYSEGEEEQDNEDSEDEREREEEELDQEDAMANNIFTRAPIFSRTTTSKSSVSTPHSTPTPVSTPSKFSWLLNSSKAPTTPSKAAPKNFHNPSDELLSLDITHALFPHGPVDPLAPSSFHDLLSAAENLCTRYQSSYRALSSALSDTRAEQSAQDDELDEAETRARHLKMQLDDMAARAVEQDQKMQMLYEELRMEKERRKEEEEARMRSLALVRGPDCGHNPHCAAYTGTQEDRDATPRKHKRVSGSGSCVSDSGFESECDSVFSRRNGAMSPTDTLPSSAASEADFDERERKPMGPPQLIQRRSTYDRVLSELPLHQRALATPKTVEIKSWGCANCEGGTQSSVWGRLAREREQNSILKRRVHELEAGVDESLDLIFQHW
ncbi:hypothetical protein BU16DRAFT_530893 [Lophium mytilinum]|uniref:Uncharacterized protein n=1 Tax=Lophium mytilinum TaxID=390894 RepID=A0A6A6QEF2_9PEZI|nr:hypothetical protein BU16DRAFT_530893 [Lophium mytilinum]